MRKITYLLLCVLLLGSATAVAQAPESRTTTTIVADVLAQMPAPDSELFNEQMSALASTGEAGVLQLVGMMVPAGQGSNARVEYALSGLSHWVSVEGREARRLEVSNAYIKALDRASDREVRAFVIRELQLIGGDEAVAPLTALLSDESLGEPARAALAAISGNALPAPSIASDELAPDAALTLRLYKKMPANPAKVTKELLKALKSDDRRYRFAALDIASDHADASMYSTLVGSLAKFGPEAQADVLNWLSQESDLPGRREVVAPIAGPAAAQLLITGDADLTSAAAGVLVKTGGNEAISALTALIGNADPQTVRIAAIALASTAGDVASAVAPLVATAGDAGKIAALNLIAGRKSVKNSATVFGQLSSAAPEVQTAAYAALKDVVSAADVDRLYPLLESAAPAHQASVQQAITATLRSLPAADQYAAVLSRMNAAAPAKQYLYYPVLASTGDRKALAIITERFDSESGAAKDAAFDALASWNGIATADKLLAIAKDPTSAAYFDRAIARYTALASNPSLDGESRRSRLVDGLDVARTDAQKRVILRGIATTGSYPGMIRAGEYLDATRAVQQAAANAVMTIALGNPQFTGEPVRVLLEKVITVIDNPDADYQRQALRKHLAEMVDVEPFVLSDEERKEGFTVLFDGTNMDSWTGNLTDYRIQSGTIALYPSRSFGGNLYVAKEYGNFIFRFEFQLTDGANNGVGIRTEKDKDAAYHGMEIQILDHDDPAYRNITPLQVHGSVYGVIGAKRAVLKPAGEWNVEEIVADGDHIKVTLNGEVILDGNIREAARGGTADGREHPGLFNKRGYIGFLGHGSQLKFRNIRIKELP
ncbi:MAG: DUF1080 domain-containing protein [Alistipes sp.]|jgi:hypothetical protein|nr:DUF1080 domain-containing protein [Alistipes sp.]